MKWYEDDGATMAYENGARQQRQITFDGRRLTFSKSHGAFVSKVKTWRVILRGAERASKISVNGKKVVSRFDRKAGLLAFTIPNSSSAIKIQFA